MKDSTGKYCLINDRSEKVSIIKKYLFLSSSSPSCYEVIRMDDAIFLFLEDHLERLDYSVRNTSFNYNIDYEYIKNILLKLQITNSLVTGNVIILFIHASEKIDISNIIVYPIVRHYPNERQYRIGVRASLYRAERERPNIKYSNYAFQKNARKKSGTKEFLNCC